jgi:hypothetical protein
MFCTLRHGNEYSDEQIAEQLRFNSVEEMHAKLKSWQLPDWLVGANTNSNKKRTQEKRTPPRLRGVGPKKDIPPASNAAELFRERLEVLRESVELLEHINEGLHGKYFARTNAEKLSVFYDGRWNDDTVVSLPGTVARWPSHIEITLIGAYALAGGRMDLLLERLRLDPSSVDAETWEKIRLCIDGARANHDAKDGLKVLARQLATLVRGGEVATGRPPQLSEADHAFACRITHYREQGLTDEEIARKESHRKKDDGTSYSVKDVTELGNLGLSWS